MNSERLLQWIQRFEEGALAAGVLLIAALTIANVISRSAFNRSLAFAEELSQFAIIYITFIGLSYAAGRGRHIRMTAISDQLPHRWKKGHAVVVAATTAGLMFLLTWFCVRYVGTVAELGSVSPVLQVPLWIVYLAAPIGLGLAGIQYVLAVVKNVAAHDVYLSWQQKDEYETEGPVSEGMIEPVTMGHGSESSSPADTADELTMGSRDG